MVGGAHPSATPLETVSEPSIDFVVISEGDKTIVELADNMKEYNAIKKIDGLAYKDEKEYLHLILRPSLLRILIAFLSRRENSSPLENIMKLAELTGRLRINGPLFYHRAVVHTNVPSVHRNYGIEGTGQDQHKM